MASNLDQVIEASIMPNLKPSIEDAIKGNIQTIFVPTVEGTGFGIFFVPEEHFESFRKLCESMLMPGATVRTDEPSVRHKFETN
jgi:hypothetical protein